MSRGAGTEGGELHGGHVVEGVVQLLADGLVLQFLGVQLVYWWAEVGRGWGRGEVEGCRRGGGGRRRKEEEDGKVMGEWWSAPQERGQDRMETKERNQEGRVTPEKQKKWINQWND